MTPDELKTAEAAYQAASARIAGELKQARAERAEAYERALQSMSVRRVAAIVGYSYGRIPQIVKEGKR